MPTARHDIWDVVVVGAGPAGCAAAAAVLAELPDARLLVLDRAVFPRDKVCGDGIAAEVEDALAGLGFDVDAVFADAPAITELTLTSPGGTSASRAMHRPVHVIPRAVFDARLVADLRRRDVQVRQHRVRTVDLAADMVVLDGALRARVVIGADGAASVVRRALHPRPQPAGTVAIAMRGYAGEPGWQHGEQVISMTKKHWPAYAWSFPIGDGRANVGYGQLVSENLTRAHLLARMADLLPGLGSPTELRAHMLPMSSGRPPITDGRVLLAGDAQSLINPLTGEGIFYAVTSGDLAGRSAAACARRGDPGATYRHLMRRSLGRHLRHTDVMARLGGRPGLIDAGVRAAAGDQHCFDDLVRLGLADGAITARILSRLRPSLPRLARRETHR